MTLSESAAAAGRARSGKDDGRRERRRREEYLDRATSFQLRYSGSKNHEGFLVDLIDKLWFRSRLSNFALEVWSNLMVASSKEEMAALMKCDMEKVEEAWNELGIE